MTEKHTTEVAELKEQLRVKQVSHQQVSTYSWHKNTPQKSTLLAQQFQHTWKSLWPYILYDVYNLLLTDCGLYFLLQLENDAELTAHIHQVKELELKLKQLTEDTSNRQSQQATVTAAVQVDTMSKQMMSLQDQLQSQESHCAKLSEDLERSYKEVQNSNKTGQLPQQNDVTDHLPFLTHFSIWPNWVQFGRTNLLYIFNGGAIDNLNSNKWLTNFKYLLWNLPQW